MTVRRVKFDPKTWYLYSGVGGNRRIIRTDGFILECVLVNPNGVYRLITTSLSLQKPDLPFAIHWSTGPWHYMRDGLEHIIRADIPQAIYQNTIEHIEPVKTLADGLGIPLDNGGFGV